MIVAVRAIHFGATGLVTWGCYRTGWGDSMLTWFDQYVSMTGPPTVRWRSLPPSWEHLR